MSRVSFVIRSPREIRFGWGIISELPAAAAPRGKCPMLVLGGGSLRKSGKLEPILEGLAAHGLEPVLFEGIEHDPSVETIDRGREAFRARGCDMMVAIGGGSVLDAAKAIAGLALESAPTLHFLDGRPITGAVAPIVACPTTSGTGAEVTHVAVLTDRSRRLKASIRTEGMMPTLALVDPELTVTLAPRPTAHTGLDAFTQAVESYLSRGANPFSDPLALEAAVRVGRWLRVAYEDGQRQEARENMAAGSMLAGLALASARLGLVHGIAHPLGALYGLEHGLACALLLPHVLEFNAPVAEAKLASLARSLGLTEGTNDTSAALKLVVWTRELCAGLGCYRPLAEIGLRRGDYAMIVEAALASGSSRANPRPVAAEDVVRLLEAAK